MEEWTEKEKTDRIYQVRQCPGYKKPIFSDCLKIEQEYLEGETTWKSNVTGVGNIDTDIIKKELAAKCPHIIPEWEDKVRKATAQGNEVAIELLQHMGIRQGAMTCSALDQ